MARTERKKVETDKSPQPPGDVSPLKPDPEYKENGGWKVHLTIGPDSYKQRVAAVKRWMRRNFEGEEGVDWKHLDGGDPHEKDFTVYLGSYATMMSFVRRLENDPIVQQLDACNAGSAERIVGDTGRAGARFDPRGRRAGQDWLYGWNGIPFAFEDSRKVLRKESPARAADRPKALLREMFGDYFLPEGIE